MYPLVVQSSHSVLEPFGGSSLEIECIEFLRDGIARQIKTLCFSLLVQGVRKDLMMEPKDLVLWKVYGFYIC